MQYIHSPFMEVVNKISGFICFPGTVLNFNQYWEIPITIAIWKWYIYVQFQLHLSSSKYHFAVQCKYQLSTVRFLFDWSSWTCMLFQFRCWNLLHRAWCGYCTMLSDLHQLCQGISQGKFFLKSLACVYQCIHLSAEINVTNFRPIHA